MNETFERLLPKIPPEQVATDAHLNGRKRFYQMTDKTLGERIVEPIPFVYWNECFNICQDILREQ